MYGKIEGYDERNKLLYISVPFADSWVLDKQHITEASVKLMDGRELSADQRKKLYAMFRDIANWCGHFPDEVKGFIKMMFWAESGEEFSLSDCDMTTARMFIDYVVEFCLRNRVPMKQPLLEHAEDIGKYLYWCLLYRSCCICGRDAHVHHVDAIGMGGSRNDMCHIGLRAMALCPTHHHEAHNTPKTDFESKYHVYGIKLDETLCKKLKIGRSVPKNEFKPSRVDRQAVQGC